MLLLHAGLPEDIYLCKLKKSFKLETPYCSDKGMSCYTSFHSPCLLSLWLQIHPVKPYIPLYRSAAGYLHNEYKIMKYDSKELHVQEKRILRHRKLSELIIISCLLDRKREDIMDLICICLLTLNLNTICEDPN